jgi:glyoxylase-like metal-dependent hydrolase (beta-lactamase superfamily II)
VIIDSDALWAVSTNCYVVAPEASGPAVIIDAPPDVAGIVQLLERHRLTPVALLVTHGHVDHVGGAGAVASATGVTAYVHPDDGYLTADPAAQIRSLFGFVPPDIDAFTPPERVTGLEHGTDLDLAGLRFSVRHTPGHTPGHCVFVLEDEGTVFTGDHLFAGSIGRTDLPGGDFDTLMASMRDQILTLPDDMRVLPGHGDETTIGRERTTNPFILHHLPGHDHP